MNKITLICTCGNIIETGAKAELNMQLEGEYGIWTNVNCPECGGQYTIKLSVCFGHS
jgi:hypothetical protein